MIVPLNMLGYVDILSKQSERTLSNGNNQISAVSRLAERLATA